MGSGESKRGMSTIYNICRLRMRYLTSGEEENSLRNDFLVVDIFLLVLKKLRIIRLKIGQTSYLSFIKILFIQVMQYSSTYFSPHLSLGYYLLVLSLCF